jgi:hypothetical protein
MCGDQIQAPIPVPLTARYQCFLLQVFPHHLVGHIATSESVDLRDRAGADCESSPGINSKTPLQFWTPKERPNVHVE